MTKINRKPSDPKIAPMYVRAAVALALLAFIADSSPCLAGGAVTHQYIARRAAEKLRNNANAPADLSAALNDPDCVTAFSNGATSPDLDSLSGAGHYNDTTTIPDKMIATSRADLAKANALPDSDPNKSVEVKQAQKELAFSYGWLSHCATDVSVHPLVNGIAGDAYAHCNDGQKAIHAGQEVQLDHYVYGTLRKEGEEIDYDIPYALVSSSTGASEEALRNDTKKMRLQMTGEGVVMHMVTVPMDTLKTKWQGVVESSLSDTVKFAGNPDEFKGWDLDCGRMSTSEFENLRDATIEANGGKLPDGWGKNYVDWFNKTRTVPPDKLKDALARLVKGEELPDYGTADLKNTKVRIRLTSATGMKVFANGTELSLDRETVVATQGSRVLTVKAMVYGKRREYCVTKTTQGMSDARIVEQNPYVFHFTVDNGAYHGETIWEVTKEEYLWTPGSAAPGRVYSSGSYPKVKDDAYDWTVPVHSKEQYGIEEKAYAIVVGGDVDWKMTRKAPTHAENEESENGLAALTVTVEPE